MIRAPTETPTMHSFGYVSTSSSSLPIAMQDTQLVGNRPINTPHLQRSIDNMKIMRDLTERQKGLDHRVLEQAPPQVKDEKMSNRRIVQIYVADPDEQVPLNKALLYKSEPFLTDETDQELFYGINIVDMLKKHNEFRITIQNKKIKERVENLEPVRIKNLSMLVVTLAQF